MSIFLFLSAILGTNIPIDKTAFIAYNKSVITFIENAINCVSLCLNQRGLDIRMCCIFYK